MLSPVFALGKLQETGDQKAEASGVADLSGDFAPLWM